MFNPFSRHVPPSDPPIPPSDCCLCCGKKASDALDAGESLKRCTKCKIAHFCNRECQALAWKGLGPDGKTKLGDGKHKTICAEIAKRVQPNMLPYKVRVVRGPRGAYIENGQDIPKARPATEEEKAKLDEKERWELEEYCSPCARDHYMTVVRNLTSAQRWRRYPMACSERWGGNPENHRLSDDYGGDEPVSDPVGTGVGIYQIPLELLIQDNRHDTYCDQCGADGEQWFSFCLNRPVNSNMVKHCEFCHKCFYFQPGCLRGCQHCGMGWYTGDDPRELSAWAENISIDQAERKLESVGMFEGLKIKYKEEARGCSVPRNADVWSRQLAAEGFWGW